METVSTTLSLSWLLQQSVLIMTIGWKLIVSQNCGERESKCRGLIPWRKSTLDYSSWTGGNCSYLFGTCRSRPIHARSKFCLRASQFESESKIRAEQYVCFRESQFQSESKSRAEQYVWEHGNLQARARGVSMMEEVLAGLFIIDE